MDLTALYGLGVLLALLAAVCAAPETRMAAGKSVAAFATGWLWYVSAWSDHPPAIVLWDLTGASVDPAVLWALGDLIVCAYIFRRCGESFWCLALVASFMGQAACHSMAALGLDSSSYLVILNITFVTQLAVFMAVGGHGFVRKEIEGLA